MESINAEKQELIVITERWNGGMADGGLFRFAGFRSFANACVHLSTCDI